MGCLPPLSLVLDFAGYNRLLLLYRVRFRNSSFKGSECLLASGNHFHFLTQQLFNLDRLLPIRYLHGVYNALFYEKWRLGYVRRGHWRCVEYSFEGKDPFPVPSSSYCSFYLRQALQRRHARIYARLWRYNFTWSSRYLESLN